MYESNVTSIKFCVSLWTVKTQLIESTLNFDVIEEATVWSEIKKS